MEKPDFKAFQKIPRYSREVVITEKIDGTNGVICVNDTGDDLIAGSRSRWITPTDDNAGFAKWVEANKAELLTLGPGLHYGEWWGPGIQRGYGLKEKRFSLFNVSKWSDDTTRPKCCSVVPTLWTGSMDAIQYGIDFSIRRLAAGSLVSPGFMRPEGIVIFHTAGGYLFKKTLEGDEKPKGSKE